MAKINKHNRLLLTLVAQLEAEGEARFDFGTFKLIRRKPRKVTLIKGDVGAERTSKPFVFISFKASKTIRDILNNK